MLSVLSQISLPNTLASNNGFGIFIYVIGIIQAALPILQVITMYNTKSSKSVSLKYWLLSAICCIFFIFFGLTSNDAFVVITNAVGFVFDFLVCFLGYHYRSLNR